MDGMEDIEQNCFLDSRYRLGNMMEKGSSLLQLAFQNKGQLMQMTMMTPPSFNDELHYLNKEDRLLRWLLVKHRNIKYGLEFLNEDDEKSELRKFGSSSLNEDVDTDDEDEDEEEYDVEQRGTKED